MAQRATSLGPKPSLFVLVSFLMFCFFCMFFGRLKAQVRWPFGPPHLALNTPYFSGFVFCFFFFPFLVLEGKTRCPPKKGHFC